MENDSAKDLPKELLIDEKRQRDEEPDDAREEKRARVYGLQLNDLLDQSIIVSPGQHVRLSGLSKEKEQGLARLRPKDLGDVKRWIGVPDELGARRSCCHNLPPAIPAIKTPKDIRTLDTNSVRAVHELAHEYVHGDSRPLASYKETLNVLVDRATITGIFLRQDIDIHSGSILEIGKDVKVLFARHIRIWRGGQLKITGPTKIDCVTITGDLLNIGGPIVAQLPSFATIYTKEVVHG